MNPMPQSLHIDGQRRGANTQVKYKKSLTSMKMMRSPQLCALDLCNRKDFCLQGLWNALCESLQVLQKQWSNEESSKKCVLPTKAMQDLLPELHTSSPLLYCASPNPKQGIPWNRSTKTWMRSHMFGTIAKPNNHWGAPAHYFPPKKPTTFPFILTRLIQIWTVTTHFFIQVVKFIIILLILLHTFRGYLCLWPYFFYWFLNYSPPYFTYNHVGNIFPML